MEREGGGINTELAKKVCPRLRDLATAPAGGITHPRTNFFGQLCTYCETHATSRDARRLT